jgi:hypothetical protein
MLTLLLVAAGWSLGDSGPRVRKPDPAANPLSGTTGGSASSPSPYFFEGTGYLTAGGFLVAAVGSTGPSWLSGRSKPA